MEENLTPLARALRKFTAGKPPAYPKDTPLAVVLLATEQRERLKRILAAEDIENPRVTCTAIAVRLETPGSPVALDDGPIEVAEGAESGAVAWLEEHLKCGNKFTISGLTFVVQTGPDVRVFQYRIERTPEGDAAMKSAGEKLIPRRTRPSDVRQV